MGNNSSKRCGACRQPTKLKNRIKCKHCGAQDWLTGVDEAKPSQMDKTVQPPVPPRPQQSVLASCTNASPPLKYGPSPPVPPASSTPASKPKCLLPRPEEPKNIGTDSEISSIPPASSNCSPVKTRQGDAMVLGVPEPGSHGSTDSKTQTDCKDISVSIPPTTSNSAIPAKKQQLTITPSGPSGDSHFDKRLLSVQVPPTVGTDDDDMMGCSSDSDFGSDLDGEGIGVVSDWLDQEQIPPVVKTIDASSTKAEEKSKLRCKFFDQFPPDMRTTLINALESQLYKDGETIVKQGDTGDTFYVVIEGEAAISKYDSATQKEKLLTHIYGGAQFGETALIYGVKRTATVRAVGQVHCNVLTRAKYQTMPQELRSFLVLQKCDLIQHLKQHEQVAICKCLEPAEFKKNDYVVREGDHVKPTECAFFMITKGDVEVFDKADGHLVNLREGHSFGEMALINDAPRNASVRVVSDILTCMTLRKAAFANCCDGEDGSFTDKLRTITKRLERVRSRRHSMKLAVQAVAGKRDPHSRTAVPALQLEEKGSVSHFQKAAASYTHKLTPRSRAAKGGAMSKNVNEYRILRTLGKGSFADVKLVVHMVTKEQHAMKVVNRRALKKVNNMSKFGDDLNKQLMLEIKIMKLLNHKSIVKVHEVVDDDESQCLYIIMELGQGGTIMPDAEECGGGKPLDPDVARMYTRQIIYALEYMHKCGVIHRDLKPQNILLSKDKKDIKICDFGTACITSQGETLTVPKGTPAFMAPEILLQETVHYCGPPADVWSLGATMYMMVVGRQPWVASDYMALSHRVRHDELKFPENDLDPHLRNLLLQILTKDPKQRPPLEMLKVHEWITDEGIDPMLKQDL